MTNAERRITSTTPDKFGVHRRRALAEHADRHFGVISTGELKALGFASSTVADLVAKRTIIRIAYGVYAVGHRHLTREGRHPRGHPQPPMRHRRRRP